MQDASKQINYELSWKTKTNPIIKKFESKIAKKGKGYLINEGMHVQTKNDCV